MKGIYLDPLKLPTLIDWLPDLENEFILPFPIYSLLRLYRHQQHNALASRIVSRWGFSHLLCGTYLLFRNDRTDMTSEEWIQVCRQIRSRQTRSRQIRSR